MVLGSYIHFTQEQKTQAASVDLEDFLRKRGETLLSSGKDKRLASDHSVTIRGNAWYDHAEEKGGYAISFVQKFYCLSYAEAVTMLLNSNGCTVLQATERQTKAGFILPPANKNMRRVFAYLVKSRASTETSLRPLPGKSSSTRTRPTITPSLLAWTKTVFRVTPTSEAPTTNKFFAPRILHIKSNEITKLYITRKTSFLP